MFITVVVYLQELKNHLSKFVNKQIENMQFSTVMILLLEHMMISWNTSKLKSKDISLLTVIQQKSGLQYDGVEDMIDIAYATEEIAAALDCEVNAPLLCVYQKVYASCGSVMYINCQYIRSDRYKYVCSSVKKS